MTWTELTGLLVALGAFITALVLFFNRSVEKGSKVASTAKTNKEAEQIEQEIESKYAVQVREWIEDLEEIKNRHDVVLAEKESRINQLHADYLNAIKDITEQKLRLDRFNKATRRILVNMDVPYWECDKSGSLVYVNGAWLKLFGLTQTEALGSNWAKTIPIEEREPLLMEWSSRVIDQAEHSIEFTVQNPLTGKRTRVRSLYAIIFDSEDEIFKIIGVTVELPQESLQKP